MASLRNNLKFQNDILKLVISQYTKEAGVRQLERVISKINA